MSEPQSKQVAMDGFKLRYWEWPGSGPAIVCLHPSNNYGRIWEWVAQRLAPEFRVLAPDQRGHGDTGHPAVGAAAEDYAADLEAFAQRIGLDRFVVAGHSLGARAAMVFAAQHPERVSHLVLVGGPHYSTLHPGADVEYWHNNSARTRARAKSNASREAALAIVRASYPHFNDAMVEHVVQHNTNAMPDGTVEWKYDPAWVADGLMHALDDLRGFAAGVKCPTLLLRAEKSWELTPERMEEIEKLLPTSKTITVPGVVQNLELEAPAEVAALIKEFRAERLATGAVDASPPTARPCRLES